MRLLVKRWPKEDWCINFSEKDDFLKSKRKQNWCRFPNWGTKLAHWHTDLLNTTEKITKDIIIVILGKEIKEKGTLLNPGFAEIDLSLEDSKGLSAGKRLHEKKFRPNGAIKR